MTDTTKKIEICYVVNSEKVSYFSRSYNHTLFYDYKIGGVTNDAQKLHQKIACSPCCDNWL
jgi:hypothetical protein